MVRNNTIGGIDMFVVVARFLKDDIHNTLDVFKYSWSL